MIEWQWYRMSELSARQLYALIAARVAVFVVEQNCPYQDLDGLDARAEHLVGWSGTQIAAYLRLLPPRTRFDEPSLGRILTTEAFRARGLGRELVLKGLRRAAECYPMHPVRISAQAHLDKFYGSLGFKVVSPPYLEDGIPHVEMLRSEADSG